jgi:hypothetical protein
MTKVLGLMTNPKEKKMKRKAIVVMFEPDANEKEVREAIRQITELRDKGDNKIDYVGQYPDTVNDEHGEPVVYVP